MSSNENLGKARSAKNDEFYTQLSDIAEELANYKHFFKDKIVYCNCDDPLWSNFWRYFHMNFTEFGLKKLMSTHYVYADKTMEHMNKENMQAYYAEYTGGHDTEIDDPVYNRLVMLKGDGDFRSPECIEYLKEADIVVTNPPFSLFREYVAQLMEYNKQFAIIGSLNAVGVNEIFPLIKDNKMWCGQCGTGKRTFEVPSTYDGADQMSHGKFYKSLGNTMWFTNLPIKKRSEKLIDTLTKSYYDENGNPRVELDEEGNPIVNEYGYPIYVYKQYDNYFAINVSKTKDIPYDYYDEMGVPITFIEKYNPNEFVIVDARTVAANASVKEKKTMLIKDADSAIDGKATYARIVIKRKYKDEAGTILNI